MEKDLKELLEEIRKVYKNNNGWKEYKIYIQNELKSLNDDMKDVKKSLSEIKVDIAGLKVKASVWGIMGGMVPALLMIFYLLIRSSL